MWYTRDDGGKQNEPPLTVPKAGLHPKKMMLCIWWNWKGVLYYELLPESQTTDSNKYRYQLDQLKAAIDEKYTVSTKEIDSFKNLFKKKEKTI